MSERMDWEGGLQRHFGLRQFRPGQREILASVLAGDDVLAVLPTGGGKSLCYQLPSCLRPGITLVISPLVALMRDQVSQLKNLRIPAGCLYAQQSREEKRVVFQEMRDSPSFLLYLSPERVQKEGFIHWFQQAPITLIAIDEAHCISQWGPDFREDYYRLQSLRSLRPAIPILALTASATPEVLFDIKRQLHLRTPQRHVYGFYRPNLYYQVETCADESEKLHWIRAALRKVSHGRVILYAGTRKRCEELVGTLAKEFAGMDFYHAGLEGGERNEKQDRFDRGEIRILCATNAFGMGIDCPDIRLVIHDQVPANLESYYQEAGRAGRDGQFSTCLLLYSRRDKGLHSYFIQKSGADRETLNRRWRTLEVMLEFAEGGECRHAGILTYFRDQNRIESCGHCDICTPQAEERIPAPRHERIEIEAFREMEDFRRELRSRKKAKKKDLPSISLAPLTAKEIERQKRIQTWRKDYAQKNQMPAFLVFSNKTLADLIRKWPQSTADLEKVYGFGPHKIETFGKELVQLLQTD